MISAVNLQRRAFPVAASHLVLVRHLSTWSDDENLIIDAGGASRQLQIPFARVVGGRDDVTRSDIQFGAATLSIYYQCL